MPAPGRGVVTRGGQRYSAAQLDGMSNAELSNISGKTVSDLTRKTVVSWMEGQVCVCCGDAVLQWVWM